MSSQPKQAMNIRAEIKSTIALADQLTEFVITARDFEKHRLLSATEFYNELMQQERFNQLKQNMLCEKVVPHAEVSLVYFINKCTFFLARQKRT